MADKPEKPVSYSVNVTVTIRNSRWDTLAAEEVTLPLGEGGLDHVQGLGDTVKAVAHSLTSVVYGAARKKLAHEMAERMVKEEAANGGS